MAKKKEEIGKRLSLFINSCEGLAMLEASKEIAFVLANKYKPFSDGEDMVKPCLHKITKWVGDKSIERLVNEIALSKLTIMRHTEELSHDVSDQQEDCVHAYSFIASALDEYADICDVVQLSISIRGSDDNFNILDEIIGLESLHRKTRWSDIFEEVRSCLECQQLNLLNSYASVLMEYRQ